MRRFLFRFPLLTVCALFSVAVSAQTVEEPGITRNHPEWSRPYPPFRIAGNLYYVGTEDLACYLITTPKGNLLINTGLAASAATIRANIESLGFRFADTRLLLTTQAHFDHLGAMEAVRLATGAKVWVNAPEAAVVADGGASDYAMGEGKPFFAPVKVDRLLKNGETIRLGGTELVLLSHPGHTRGSCSYLLKTKDSARSYTILIANLPTIVTEKKFTDVAGYPTIAADYAATLASLQSLQFDLWVASHGSQFGLLQKRRTGDPYNPAAFSGRADYDKALAELRQAYEAHLRIP